MPERLLVVGSGAIGVEFASFYSGLGSKVTMVEALPQILPAEDEEIAKFARAQFEKQGIAIRTGATVRSAKRAPDGRTVATVEGEGAPEEIVADAIIVAVGVQGNVENLGLEALGVKLDRGLHRRGWIWPHQRARPLRDWRRRRAADAGAQGRA